MCRENLQNLISKSKNCFAEEPHMEILKNHVVLYTNMTLSGIIYGTSPFNLFITPIISFYKLPKIQIGTSQNIPKRVKMPYHI